MRLIIAITTTLFIMATGCGDGVNMQFADAGPATCPADTEREGEACVREVEVPVTCADPGGPQCPDGSECLADTGVCYQRALDRLCKVELTFPTSSTALKMPAAEVEIRHFNAVPVGGGTEGCNPQLMYIQYEIYGTRSSASATNFMPTFRMMINGQPAPLTEIAGGDITSQWYSRLYSWSGPFAPSGNVGGEDIRLFCTNCSASVMPSGIAIDAKVNGFRWSQSPLDAEQSVYENVGREHLTIFAPPPT
ncbi:MAG: hypothetical protein HYT15_04145 [Candidatus Magasanikbacteria bacterium]|nr:hypothetical protein [Candidatus Magasanikbacteria bacterium]